MQEKILLTGGHGFIGSHLKRKLQGRFDIVDLRSDLLDFSGITEEVTHVNPDYIIHLAARTEVEKSFYDPVGFSSVNYTGTVNLIESARQRAKNLKLFVFSSTMETYGWQPVSDQIQRGEPPKDAPKFTEQTLQNPNAPYAVAKLACEQYLFYAQRAYGFPYCILRQSNTYGRTNTDFFVVEQIISQMLKNDEIYLGNRAPWRNFLFIDDLIRLYEAVLTQWPIAKGEVFCTGPDNALSIEELVGIIAQKLNWLGQIHWGAKPHRHGEIYYLNSTEAYAKKVLGWEPRVTLSEGLDRTIEAWKRLHKTQEQDAAVLLT